MRSKARRGSTSTRETHSHDACLSMNSSSGSPFWPPKGLGTGPRVQKALTRTESARLQPSGLVNPPDGSPKKHRALKAVGIFRA